MTEKTTIKSDDKRATNLKYKNESGVLLLKGKCYYCDKEFSKAGILKHIKSCKVMNESMKLQEKAFDGSINKFILEIHSKYDKNYWLYIAINVNCKLTNLDKFLRDIWVECCGHLSMFEINGERYESKVDTDDFWGMPSKSMDVRLKSVISVNDTIEYEYDFGSTTYLEIKVIDRIACLNKGKDIELIARNNEPEIKCSNCGSKASYYDRENQQCLCDNCFKNYAGDKDMIEELGYVNSPRAGVCGYYGSKEDGVKYLPIVKDGKVITVGSFQGTTQEEVNDEEEDYTYEDEDDESLMDFKSSANRASKSILKQELKDWNYIENNSSLEYHLNRFTKGELTDIAQNLYIEKISKLKKEELKNKILDSYEEKSQFIVENMGIELFEILLKLSADKMYEARNYDGEINAIDYFRDMAFLFTGEVDGKDVIIVPEELKKVILSKDNDEFKKKLEKNGQIIKLFWGMCNYYGVVELETFKELVKKYIDFDISNMNLPVILQNGAHYCNEFEFNGDFGNDVLVCDVPYILSEHEKRSDLQFYPFEKEELLKAAKIDFEDKTEAYNEFYNFLTKNFNINDEEADDLIFSLEADCKNAANPQEVMSNFLGDFDVPSIREENIILIEVLKFYNNMRLWVTKGYTPQELIPVKSVKKEDRQK